jgi:DNA-directed RNA polymerase subunit RPC12/RpoP
MDSQKTFDIHCPQCNNVCSKTIVPIDNTHSIACTVCGYQEIKTIYNTEKFKGYGSLVMNNTAVLFHEPISFEKEQEILKGISVNPNATFIKWTDKHGLTVLKGELPLEYTEEEITHMLNENEYYNSLSKSNCNKDNYIPFNIN